MSVSQLDDNAIRLAAGTWLQREIADQGPELERSLLRHGFQFRNVRIPLIHQQGIWKPRMLEMPLSITTSPTNPYEDGFDREAQLLRYGYFGRDPDHPHNVGLRRLMETQRPLVYFHGVRVGLYLPFWPAFIVGDDPDGFSVTVAVDNPPYAEERLISEGEGRSDAPPEDRKIDRGYTTRVALTRIHQRVFRHRVLRAYQGRCAFCRLRQEPLLDAAHIVPDRDPTGDPVVPNGLTLCKIHHAAFDGMFLGVTPKGVIHVRSDLLREKDGPMLQHGLQGLHDEHIHRPRRTADHPDPDRLEQRYLKFREAS